MPSRCEVICFVILVAALPCPTLAESEDDLLDRARAAIAGQEYRQAIELANEAIALNPESEAAYALRAYANDSLRDYKAAVADYSRVLELVPQSATTYDRRGSARFKLGRIDESIADFDRFIELRPDEKPGHWRRGISYYYAGRFEDGYEQFAGYQTVEQNDVENAVWHYLCYAKAHGKDAARKALLPIGHDRRVPMMTVYELFRGNAKPDDVLAAANNEKLSKAERKLATFYAHLYLGLWHESEGDANRSLENMQQAVTDLENGGYMWDVARVHVMQREGTGEGAKTDTPEAPTD